MKISGNVILLTTNEVKNLCKPGEGSNTCIWLTIGGKDFECSFYRKPTALAKRYVEGLTVAKRNGCEEVKKLNLEYTAVKAQTLAGIMRNKNENNRP